MPSPTRREAEAELEERRKRREELEIRPLSPDAAQRYLHEWQGVQVRFVDDPVGATRDADRLVQQVMSDRGYPMDDFEDRADLISVDHPTVVDNYRQAHTAHLAYDRGDANTEDLRQAMVHYRSTADIASRSGSKARVDEAAADGNEHAEQDERQALLAEDATSDVRSRWERIQGSFVDEPRCAVEEADALVVELMHQLADSFAQERHGLEGPWDRGDEVSTEELRIALRRYRSFFDRLLSA